MPPEAAAEAVVNYPDPFLPPIRFLELVAELRKTPIPVLGGFIQLLGVMGDEKEVLDAARVTAQSVAKTPADDTGLMRYLMRHHHGTPFEMVEMKFLVQVPMDTWRQWIRHRTANVNEYSTRYTEAIDECQVTCPDKWRTQGVTNRQGSSGNFVEAWPADYFVVPCYPDETIITDVEEIGRIDEATHQYWGVFKLTKEDAALSCDPTKKYFFEGPRSQLTPGLYLSAREQIGQVNAREDYEERLEFKVAKEQARKDLPLSTMTRAVWKCDLRNIFHFLGLRMHGHAQYEIRMFANAMGKIVEMLYPVAFKAFLDFELNSMKLSALDVDMIGKMVAYCPDYAKKQIEAKEPHSYLAPYPEGLFNACLPDAWRGEKSSERAECLAKLRRLGLVAQQS